MSTPFDFVGLGEILVDVISDEFTSDLYNGERFRMFIGGQVTNIALNLALLGARSALAGAVGADHLGEFCRKHLELRGVDTSLVQTVTEPTSLMMVGRSRTTPWFTPYRRADYQVSMYPALLEAVNATRLLHTSAHALGHEPLRSTVLQALEYAAARNINVSFDPNYHPAVWDGTDPQDVMPSAFRYVTLTKPSLDDCIRIFGPGLPPEEYIGRFHRWGARYVVMSRGGHSALVSDGQTITELPLPDVEVVDVTGAGDAFWSGMLMELLHGRGLLEAAHAGVQLAARKVQQVGPLTKVTSTAQ